MRRLVLAILLIAASHLSAATPEWKNVQSYTGTDAQKIAAAITALGTTGGVVYFPPGTYDIDTQVNLASNIILKGDGYASRIVFRSTVTLGFYGASVSNVAIEDLSFGGYNSATEIKFYLSSNIRIRNLDMSGAQNYALLFDHVDDITVANCRFTDNGVSTASSAAMAILADTANRVTFANNTVIASSSSAPYLTMGIGLQNAADSVVTGNSVSGMVVRSSDSGAWGYGIYLYAYGGSEVTRAHVTNNRITSTGGDGIYLQGVTDSTVTGNSLNDVCKTITGGALAEGAIAANSNSARVVISNNSIHTSGKAAIRDDAPGCTISGNQIDDVATAAGVLFAGIVSGTTVTGNSITNCGGGIEFAGAPSSRVKGLTVTGNTIDPGTVDASGNHGISIWKVDDASITGNVVRASAAMGIILTDVTAFTVDSNTVHNAKYPNDGIYLDSCSKGVVSNNRSYGTSRYGIVLTSTTTAVRVSDNYTTDNATGGILDAGVGNTVQNNN